MRLCHYLPVMFLLLSATSVSAGEQWRQHRWKKPVESRFSRKYIDSLLAFRDSVYSDNVYVHKLKTIDTAPFFLPITFYHGIAQDAFSLSKSLTPIEQKLLGLYLNHPELVENTEHNLDETGPVLAPKTITESPTSVVAVTKPEEPEPLPVDIVVLKPNFWTFSGDYSLQMIQNYLTDNWYQGGESNYSMLGAVTLTANYNNKQKVKWDNMLELKYGMQTSKSDSIHKVHSTEDMIRYTGKLGLQATKKWYYTFQLIAQTQFARHYKANSDELQSDFGSPFNLNASVGMDYDVCWLKKRITGSIHLAPLAYNFKYVGRVGLAGRNGIDEGHHAMNDFGSQITVNLDWKLSDNMSWKTRLYWYTTYERTEAEWENTFSFQFNRYLATKIFLYPRFDDANDRDDKMGYWMFKEYVSFGFSYTM